MTLDLIKCHLGRLETHQEAQQYKRQRLSTFYTAMKEIGQIPDAPPEPEPDLWTLQMIAEALKTQIPHQKDN